MRVLLAGASGFIGRALATSLRSDGHDVHAAGRPGSTDAEVIVDVRERRVDLSRVEGGIGAFDVVFQLLGEPITPRRWSVARREAMQSSRITTTELLARAIAGSDGAPPAFVVGTAIGYYGDRGDERLDETSAGGDGFLADLCRAWEAAASPAKAAGARVVLARSGIVIGPGGGALATQLRAFRLGLGARLGSGTQWTSWISLIDEVRALRFAAEHREFSGPANLVSPEPVTNAELTAEIAAAVHRRARLVVPRPVLLAAVGRRTTDEFLLASQRVDPARLLAAGFEFELPSSADAIRAALG